MIFADLAAGDSVFIDANILTYHFEPHPLWGPACSQLLQRIENSELRGFTSIHILGELAHRMMTVEASAKFGWPFAGIGNRLRGSPTCVQKLSAFRTAIDRVLQSSLRVLTAPPAGYGLRALSADWLVNQRRLNRCRHAGKRFGQASEQRRRFRPCTRLSAIRTDVEVPGMAASMDVAATAPTPQAHWRRSRFVP